MFPTCPCKSVLRSIKAHVRANTAPEDIKKRGRMARVTCEKKSRKHPVNHYGGSPEVEKESGLHSWKRQAKCCSTRSLSWVSPISSTTFKKDLSEGSRKENKKDYEAFYERLVKDVAAPSKLRLCNSHLREWSRVCPVKSKNFRYSSPTARLKSWLKNGTIFGGLITGVLICIFY